MTYRHVRTDDTPEIVAIVVSLAVLHGQRVEVVPVAGCNPGDIVAMQQAVEDDAYNHGRWVDWRGLTARFYQRKQVAA